MSGAASAAARALLVAAGAVAVRAALAGTRTAFDGAAQRSPQLRWARTNFRGETVSLAGGPALAVAASVTAAAGAPGRAAAAAALTAGLGAGAVGLYDDLVGGRPEHQAKGFHGHLAALRSGRLTSGMTKVIGIGAAGLTAATLLRRRSVAETLLAAGVIAGAANLANLLDLRPGRALKAGLLAGAPLLTGPTGALAAGPVGAVAGLLPDDLAERTMLGDSGANALGALLGTALAARTGPAGKAVALTVIAGLTLTSERVSFTQVIARTPGLRELDQLGRRAGASEASGAAGSEAAAPLTAGPGETGGATPPPSR
jgi:UDP-N-acetylmuramyl pentapeptide phosphotransferase/UDP-N-acetylglucosamine-1-phosphate transferase